MSSVLLHGMMLARAAERPGDLPPLPPSLEAWITADQFEGRLSPEDADLLREWIDGAESVSLRGWLDHRTDLSTNLTQALETWLRAADSAAAIPTAGSTVPPFREVSGAFRLRGGVLTRVRGDITSGLLSLTQELDSLTEVSADIGLRRDSLRVLRRQLHYHSASGIVREARLGSFDAAYGLGLLVSSRRPLPRTNEAFGRSALFPGRREFNGVALELEHENIQWHLMTSYTEDGNNWNLILAGAATVRPDARTSLSLIGRQMERQQHADRRRSINAVSADYRYSDEVTALEVEAGMQFTDGLARPGVMAQGSWRSGGRIQLRHDLRAWLFHPRWYQPEWVDLLPTIERRRMNGLWYHVTGISHGQERMDLTLIGLFRNPDTLIVLLQPSITVASSEFSYARLRGELRSRQPAVKGKAFVDEGEGAEVVFGWTPAAAKIEEQIGVESFNGEVRATAGIDASLRSDTWSLLARTVVRDLRSGARASWRLLLEGNVRLAGYTAFLRGIAVSRVQGSLGAMPTSQTIEAGFSCAW